ncbi:MAG: hypothetical protein EOO24_50645, partial [Comamonadaceae bacterium]
MVLPVAQALRDRGLANVQVVGLTTAAGEVRAAGLPLLRFKDFVVEADARAIERGRSLTQAMRDVVDPEE